MTVTQLAAWVMLAFGGLFSGAILVFAVERVNLWRRMPVDQYVVDFRRSLYRADPLIPIMGILSALGAVVFALNSGGRAAVLAWTATPGIRLHPRRPPRRAARRRCLPASPHRDAVAADRPQPVGRLALAIEVRWRVRFGLL
jgi:hypothetical protein